MAGAKNFGQIAKAMPWLDIFVPSLDEARSISGVDSPEKIIAKFRDEFEYWIEHKRSKCNGVLNVEDTWDA